MKGELKVKFKLTVNHAVNYATLAKIFMLMKIIVTGWKVFILWQDVLIYWFIRYILTQFNILLPHF